MSRYGKAIATSLRLLTSFGQDVTRQKITTEAYDPATGQAAKTVETSIRKGVLLNFGQGVTEVRGTAIQASDKHLLLDPTGEALLSDRYIVNGTLYSVISINETNPAGEPILFELHLRQ